MGRPRSQPSPGKMQLVKLSSPPPASGGSAGASSSRALVPRPTTLATSFNMNMLLGMAVHSNPSLRELVEELGTPGLVSLRVVGNFNRIFSLWLLSKLDPETMLLDVGGGDFVLIDDIAVNRAIGVKLGGELIELGTPADREGALAAVHALLRTGMRRSNNIPVVKLRKLLMSCPEGPLTMEQKDQMAAAFTMVAQATFLYPIGSTYKVGDELLTVVSRPREIKNKNLARYVADGLRDGARIVRKGLPAHGGEITLHGNLLTLQIAFLDRKVHGKDGEKMLPTPRSEHFNYANLKQLIRMHAPTFLEFFSNYEQAETPIRVTPLACVQPTPPVIRGPVAVHAGPTSSAPVMIPSATMSMDELQDNLITAVKSMMETHVATLTACDLEYDARARRDAEKMAAEKTVRRKRELDDAISVFAQTLSKRFSPNPTGPTTARTGVRVTEELATRSRNSARDIMSSAFDATASVAATPNEEPMVPDINLSVPENVVGSSSSDFVHRLALSSVLEPVVRVPARAPPDVKPNVRGAVAKYTPIRNRRLQLPVIQEGPTPPPSPQGLMEPEPLQNLEFGFSPFELELEHSFHDPTVALEFYEMVMACAGAPLDSTWFHHTNPVPLSMSGHKLKANYNVHNSLMYNGMEAEVRCFNEKEVEMMAGSGGEPVWRCFMSAELALNFATTLDPVGQQRVLSMFSTACRMLMAPLTVADAWCLYVFDMSKKRVNVLDPMYTLCDEEDFKEKHCTTIASMLLAVKAIGVALDDGWHMNCSEWTPRFNNAWHLPCTVRESAYYVMYYAEHFEEDDLDVAIPVEGLTLFSKRRLYEIMAMRGNIGTRPGFMLTEDEV